MSPVLAHLKGKVSFLISFIVRNSKPYEFGLIIFYGTNSTFQLLVNFRYVRILDVFWHIDYFCYGFSAWFQVYETLWDIFLYVLKKYSIWLNYYAKIYNYKMSLVIISLSVNVWTKSWWFLIISIFIYIFIAFI